jgi:hypothetical protein
MTMRSNSEVFFRALQSGLPVQFNGRTWKQIKAGEDIVCPSGVYHSDWDVLVTLGTMSKGDGPDEQIMMVSDMGYNDIMQMCSKMTEAERFDIITSNVLMMEHSRKR